MEFRKLSLPLFMTLAVGLFLTSTTITTTTSHASSISNGTTGQLHSIVFPINGGGSAITTGSLNSYPPVDFSCTINRVDITGNPSGSITIDIWKANAAIPTAANKISASAPITLSSSQVNLNGSLTGWTTGVVTGDIFGGTVASVSTVTSVTATIWCQ